jgi:hypothetical protein
LKTEVPFAGRAIWSGRGRAGESGGGPPHSTTQATNELLFTELRGIDPGAGQISSDGLNCGAGAQKVTRPHPSLLPQEKVQKKSVVRPRWADENNCLLFPGGGNKLSNARVQ